MIHFPPEFVRLQYEGYFFNTLTKRLYSIKGGSLKELRSTPVHTYTHFTYIRPQTAHNRVYLISDGGKRKTVTMEELEKIPKIPYDMLPHHPIERPEYKIFNGGNQQLSELFEAGVQVEWRDSEGKWQSVPFASDEKQYRAASGIYYRVSNPYYKFRVKTRDISNDR
jgi:hypothetical protein